MFDADKNIGTLRTVVDSPQLGTALALAYLKRDHNDIGRELRVGEVSAVVRELRDSR